MSEKHISEELWMRFLDGNVSEEENEWLVRLIAEDDGLLDMYIAVCESMKRIDSQPLTTPDIEKADQQIHAVMGDSKTEEIPVPTIPLRSCARRIWAAAAVAVALIGVALFFLFRTDHSDNNFAKQEENRMEQEANQQAPGSETTIETEQTDRTRQNDMPSKSEAEGVQPTSPATSAEYNTTQKLDKNYAAVQEANSLTVTKPSKENYRVLCKNLEKTLGFEWSATNAQTLHFVVKDSKGKTIAESKDGAANHYSLKYSDIHPEQKLTWSIVVVYMDGSQDKRSGEIQIDYNF